MSKERREHERLATSLEVTWAGAGTAAKVRVADLSVGGCWIDTRSEPAVGDRIHVKATLSGEQVSLPGTVVNVQRGLGFAIKFAELDEATRTQLTTFLESTAK